MEIKIEEDHAKEIYLSYDGKKRIVSFENLVLLAKDVIEIRKKKKDEQFNVMADSSLELYRSTVDKMIKDVLSDAELLELLAKKDN